MKNLRTIIIVRNGVVMRKFLTVLLPFLIMLIVSGACIGIYFAFTTGLPNFKKKVVSDGGLQNQVDDSGVILTEEELPRVDACGIAQPLMTALIKNFTQDNNISEGSLGYSSTDEGFDKLLKDEVDVLISTYPSDDYITRAEANGIDLEITPIAKDGFVFFTNPTNSLDSIKVSDIQKIYNGQIKNWSQIGGADLAIKAFQYPDNSSTQMEMISSVMKRLEMVDAPKDVFYDKKFGEINDVIATYDNSEGSLGYTYFYEANVLYDTDAKVDGAIKILKVNDVAPSYDTIKNDEYPVQVNYYLIRNKNNTSESLKLFTDAVLSERGKRVIKEAGYIDN